VYKLLKISSDRKLDRIPIS